MRLPLETALAATGAKLLNAEQSAPASLHVSTDTRTISRGDTFLALRGKQFDGHDFAAEALRRGAALLVLEREDPRVGGAATMLVADAKRAYMALGRAARAQFDGRVIAITGSVGKTTTKSFLHQLLSAVFGDRALAAPANENNEIGVSKLLLRASNELHDILVVEMGARHYGDVADLVEIARPHVGILTNVGEAHLEIMGSRMRLEETKWALFAQGAHAVLNADDAVLRRRATSLERRPHWFACEESLLDPVTVLDEAGRLFHRRNGASLEYSVELNVPGAHNRANAAAALAGAIELGVPLETLIASIPRLHLPQGRYDRIPLRGGVRLIYDAYNANASGMIAALDAFASEAASRRIAVLASMAELGEESKALHERVGAHAAGRVDMLLVHGEYATELARGAERGGLSVAQIIFVETNAQAARWLREHTHADDAVLLKGSRKYKLEEIVEELRT